MGFEPRISGVGCSSSANCATTTAHLWRKLVQQVQSATPDGLEFLAPSDPRSRIINIVAVMREMIICELAPTQPPRPPKPAPGVATAFHPGSKFSPPINQILTPASLTPRSDKLSIILRIGTAQIKSTLNGLDAT